MILDKVPDIPLMIILQKLNLIDFESTRTAFKDHKKLEEIANELYFRIKSKYFTFLAEQAFLSEQSYDLWYKVGYELSW